MQGRFMRTVKLIFIYKYPPERKKYFGGVLLHSISIDIFLYKMQKYMLFCEEDVLGENNCEVFIHIYLCYISCQFFCLFLL